MCFPYNYQMTGPMFQITSCSGPWEKLCVNINFITKNLQESSNFFQNRIGLVWHMEDGCFWCCEDSVRKHIFQKVSVHLMLVFRVSWDNVLKMEIPRVQYDSIFHLCTPFYRMCTATFNNHRQLALGGHFMAGRDGSGLKMWFLWMENYAFGSKETHFYWRNETEQYMSTTEGCYSYFSPPFSSTWPPTLLWECNRFVGNEVLGSQCMLFLRPNLCSLCSYILLLSLLHIFCKKKTK